MDRVVNMSEIHNVKIRGEEKIINPEIWFHRICCTINDSSDMKEYLKYELAQIPPSLFNKDGTMRSNGKSELGKILKEKVSCDTFSNVEVCVVDGGHLLHTVNKWVIGTNFNDICGNYVQFEKNLAEKVIICFDGYGNMSTKSAQQEIRAKGKSSKMYEFDYDMSVQLISHPFKLNLRTN